MGGHSTHGGSRHLQVRSRQDGAKLFEERIVALRLPIVGGAFGVDVRPVVVFRHSLRPRR